MNRFDYLLQQWHPELNQGAVLSDFSEHSHRKAWWVCERGHEWESQIRDRFGRNRNCPFCSGRKVLSGFNDLATTHPDVAAQWHPVNNAIDVQSVSAGSGRKVWWLGLCGHEWVAQVGTRTNGSGCPVCAKRKPQTTLEEPKNRLITSFAARHPDISAEWHPTRNGEVLPEQVSYGSEMNAWWVCEQGHEYQMVVGKRSSGRSCPVCSGRKVLSGFNDLATMHPKVASEWHSSKNKIALVSVSAQSHKEYWWVCASGHEWRASVGNRSRGRGCPICANKSVMVGFNDLSTTHPLVAAQWHPTLNGELSPEDVTYGSAKQVIWVCAKSHIWESPVYARNVAEGNNCLKCWQESNVSKGEKLLAEHVSNLGLNVSISDRKILSGKEIDIYIPEKKIGVEFNGVFWHSESAGKTRFYHHEKWLAAKEAGVQLIQIWEDDWNRNPDLVKRMLTHKLGISEQRKVFARKTKVEQLGTEEARKFLYHNHIQGFASGSYYLGLRDLETSEIVAVLVLKKEPGTEGRTLNIIRYATSCNVVGGFTKLLSHVEKTYQPAEFITFADHCVSDGGLYENNGFVADKELAPDYMYVVNGERKHKFGYRLKRFKDNPALDYAEGLTERELAALNGLHRIWDAGKTRYLKQVN